MSGIVITPGLASGSKRLGGGRQSTPRVVSRHEHVCNRRAERLRGALLAAIVALLFVGVGAQVLRLSWPAPNNVARIAVSAPLATAFARPDIIDRNGRLLATTSSCRH